MDRGARAAGLAAFAIAGLSLLYAVVYLGVVRPQPGNFTAAGLASAFIGISGILVGVVAIAVGDRVTRAKSWIALFGVGWGLLSAVHGVYDAIQAFAGLPPEALSGTDPRGLATFGLAGLWTIAVGWSIRAGGSILPRGLGTLAIVAGVDLIALFFSSAFGLATPILVTGGLASVIVGPGFWIWTGRALRV